MKPAAVTVTGLRKTFHPGTAHAVHALQGVDLTITPGEFAIVIGTNGSGKSTLLNAIAGSFPVDEGRIDIAAHNVTRWPEARRARWIGRVFQNPFSGTAASLSIAENFAIAARRGHLRGLSPALGRSLRRTLRDRVATLQMGLEDRLDTPIGTLSGGQRQALTLLMATWERPHLLLLDEHTAALDPKSAEQVLRLSADVIARGNLTALMVTHSMSQACQLGTRIVMMHRGRVHLDFGDAEKARLRPDDLLQRFEEIRRLEMLDESTADVLREAYA